MAELETLQKQNRKAALDRFVKAVWQGQEVEQLLSLAGAAGLDGPQADALAARITQGRDQLAQANQLPRLRKDAATAQERLDKAQARLDAETGRLEAQVDEASYAASHARKAVCVAEECSRQLLALHDESLLLVDMPKEVARLIECRNAEAKFNLAHQAMRKAVEEREYRRNILRDAEEALAHAPIVTSLEYEGHKRMLKDRVKEARRRLDQAESNVKKAEAAVEAARKAVPVYS